MLGYNLFIYMHKVIPVALKPDLRLIPGLAVNADGCGRDPHQVGLLKIFPPTEEGAESKCAQAKPSQFQEVPSGVFWSIHVNNYTRRLFVKTKTAASAVFL